MNSNPSIPITCSITSSFFDLGCVQITQTAKVATSESEILNALRRHVKCDFGEVSFEHYNGNLELIEEMRGRISSIYSVLSGKRISVMTRLDEFEPHTNIVLL